MRWRSSISRLRADSARFRSVMSRATLEAPMILPSVDRSGTWLSRTSIGWPLLCSRTVSCWSMTSPLRVRASISATSSRCPSGMMISTWRPIASLAE